MSERSALPAAPPEAACAPPAAAALPSAPGVIAGAPAPLSAVPEEAVRSIGASGTRTSPCAFLFDAALVVSAAPARVLPSPREEFWAADGSFSPHDHAAHASPAASSAAIHDFTVISD